MQLRQVETNAIIRQSAVSYVEIVFKLMTLTITRVLSVLLRPSGRKTTIISWKELAAERSAATSTISTPKSIRQDRVPTPERNISIIWLPTVSQNAGQTRDEISPTLTVMDIAFAVPDWQKSPEYGKIKIA